MTRAQKKFLTLLVETFLTRTGLSPNDVNLDETFPGYYADWDQTKDPTGKETANEIVVAYIEKYDLDDLTSYC